MFLLTNCIVLVHLINLAVGESFEDFILDAHNKHGQNGGLTDLTYDESGAGERKVGDFLFDMCSKGEEPEYSDNIVVYSVSPSQSWSEPKDISLAKKAFEDSYDDAVEKFEYDESSPNGCSDSESENNAADVLNGAVGELTQKLFCEVKVFNILISFLACFSLRLCRFPRAEFFE